MKTYLVTLGISGSVSYEVEAENKEDAEEKAYDLYEMGDEGSLNWDADGAAEIEELV
jgi:hypothetical protein